MAERIIVWLLFGLALSMTPLVIVAAIGWLPASGWQGFASLFCNEEMLAVAFTLGGAAAADVLTSRDPALRLLKLVAGGMTFLTSILCMAFYVVVKTHAGHLDPQQTLVAVVLIGGTTLACAATSEILSGARR